MAEVQEEMNGDEKETGKEPEAPQIEYADDDVLADEVNLIPTEKSKSPGNDKTNDVLSISEKSNTSTGGKVDEEETVDEGKMDVEAEIHDEGKQSHYKDTHDNGFNSDSTVGAADNSYVSLSRDHSDNELDEESERLHKEPIDMEMSVVTNDDFEVVDNERTLSISPVKKRRRIDMDMSLEVPQFQNVPPELLLPFEKGWLREIVFRGTTGDSVSRTADVYYHPPGKGKKLRSNVQVAEYLTSIGSDLTISCFTFRKKSIYKPPYEVIRQAGSQRFTPAKYKEDRGFLPTRTRGRPKKQFQVGYRGRGRGTGRRGKGRGESSPSHGSLSSPYSPDTSASKSVLYSPLSETNEGYSPTNARSTPTSTPLSQSPSPRPPSVESKPILGKQPTARKRTGGNQLSKNKLFQSSTPSKLDESSHAKTVLCGLDCAGRGGMPPSLHCGVCMCLFHPECVGFVGLTRAAMFICSRCQSQVKNKTSSSAGSVHNALSGQPVESPIRNGVSHMNVIGTITTSMDMRPTQADGQSTKPVPTGLYMHPPPLRPAGAPIVTGPRPRMPPPLRTPSSIVQTNRSVVPPPQSSTFQTVRASETSLKDLASMGNSNQLSGQLLTLPSGVLNKLNMDQPLALKVKNQTLMIPPHCFVSTPEGVKVFLPTGTLPSQLFNQETAKAINMNLPSNQTLNVSSPPAQIRLSEPSTLEPISITPVSDNSAADFNETSKEKRGRSSRSRIIPSLCFINKLHAGFDCMLSIFGYLQVSDLLKASRVCRIWRDVANQNCLWKVVRLQGCQVANWEGAAEHIKKRGTKTLDMRGMLLFEDKNRTWHQLTGVLRDLDGLRNLDLGQCPASFLHAVSEKLPNLEVLKAEYITDSFQEPQMWNTFAKVDIGKLSKLEKLKELRIRGQCGLILPSFSFSEGFAGLTKLQDLRHLSLTTLRDIKAPEFAFLGKLRNLEFLEIGDCTLWTPEIYEELGKLIKLKTLRLESGGKFKNVGLGAALKNMNKLMSLELIHFVLGEDVAETLKEMKQLEKFSVWPNINNEAAKVNSCTLSAVTDLSFLDLLEWGVMTDFKSTVTNTDSENSSSSEPGKQDRTPPECIPFLPNRGPSQDRDAEAGTENQSPEYISIGELVGRLHTSLPDTKIRVFRVPNLRASKAPVS